jgi:hypothetical protein
MADQTRRVYSIHVVFCCPVSTWEAAGMHSPAISRLGQWRGHLQGQPRQQVNIEKAGFLLQASRSISPLEIVAEIR